VNVYARPYTGPRTPGGGKAPGDPFIGGMGEDTVYPDFSY